MSTKTNPFLSAQADARVSAARAALVPHILNSPEVRAILRYFPVALRPEVRINPGQESIYFSLNLYGLDGFKDKRLTQVLRRIASDEAWKAETSDWTGSNTPNRDFVFRSNVLVTMPARSPHTRYLVQQGHYAHASRAVQRVYVCVTIGAYAKADNPTCKIVTKGFTERVVREEIKEIVCA